MFEDGKCSYVYSNNQIVQLYPCISIMVSSADDLTALTEIVAPGSIAYTAGEQNKWQLGIDYTWHSFSADETSETPTEEPAADPSEEPGDEPSEEPTGE